MHFLLWTKGSHESTNFDTFKCSDENLPNSSCHFPNHKSVFLQILHDSSVSWNITPLYFFRSNVAYFAQKRPIKVQFFRLFSARIKFHQILVIFETKNSFFFICTTLQYHETQFLCNFLAEISYTFNNRSLSKYKFGEILPEQSEVWNFAL